MGHRLLVREATILQIRFSLPAARTRHCATMAAEAAVGRSVVVGVAVPWIASCWVPASAIVVGADSHRSSDQCNGNQSRRRGVLVPHHFRALIELHASPAEFLRELLLECWILALQVRAAERWFVDRLRISVESFARGGARAQGARNEQGDEHPQINNCQENPQ